MPHYHKRKKKGAGRSAIGAKIEHLKDEGKTQKQAVGQALGMARSGDLGRAAQAAAPPPKGKIRLRKKGKR